MLESWGILALNKELYNQFINIIMSCGEFTMNKFQRSKVVPEQLRYAVVPKPLLKRFILGRSIRCAVCIALSGLLLVPLTVLPGLILFVLPAEITLISKIRDETELIQWVRCNMEPQDCRWDDVESKTELARLRGHDRPSTLQGYTR
jgi:hypothetical protein